MRRLLSITVLLLFALPFLAPLLALASSSSPSDLPSCCRRLGAHHCAMPAAERAQLTAARERTLTAPASTCPFRAWQPAPAPTAPYTPAAAPSLSSPLTLIHTSRPAQAAAGHRISRDRARHKRGPPARLEAAFATNATCFVG